MKYYWRPDKNVYEYNVAGVEIREEKFISANDVVSTIITSSRPVVIEFDGHSFHSDQVAITKNATCVFDVGNNAVHIVEGGTVRAKVLEDPIVVVEATLMYNNMSTVLSSSRTLQNVELTQTEPGVWAYKFQLDVDSSGTTLSWVMDDEYEVTLTASIVL